MKQLFYLVVSFLGLTVYAQVTLSPNPYEVDESVTITVDVNSTATDCNGLNNPGKVYMHSGIGTDGDAFGFSVVGNWGQDDGVGEMTNNGNGTYSITIVPETYYGLTANQSANATKIGIVFRNADGSQEMKANGCSDFEFNVGSFQVNLTSPSATNTVLNSGGSINITATNTNGNASYTLRSNGTVLNTNASTSSYSFNHTGITSNQQYELAVVQNGKTIRRLFSAVVNPNTVTQALPNGMEDGINYDPSDPTKATLVLDAPNKDFVYVAGSFNNWNPTSSHAMRKDSGSTKFWLELTGLTPGQIETYQYWVVDQSPIANSPQLVKTADPYSTLVLSDEDRFIPTGSYPNLPAYPSGVEREVTVLQTGQTPYPWQVTNFTKPKKEDLIIYEVLVRDFDANRTYQDLIDRIDYFKNLNINAIELMPVMEFEGNESWGYNTSFHMALDKFYGSEQKFKEFIDLCHQNGIAVILDLAINHAFGRNPLVRMWMDDPDGNGWGEPSAENPYFNQSARHSFNVGSDFNHGQVRTKYYTERVVKHWIEEFKIDGIRWDLTKGFTQNCSGGDDGCTNAYQQDRVDRLKAYADYSWSLDPDHYVIFEHLGTDGEEQQWANHRINEGKGIMLWGKMTDQYNQLTMGFGNDANIVRMGHVSRGFQGKRLIGYAESHDEERLMYKNLQFGNANLPAHNVRNLNTALSRMSALGAASVLIPGPKMIWHFGSLGMDDSIFTCGNGSVNTESDPISGNCKLDTKPQPQWSEGWLNNALRKQIYDDWAYLHQLKVTEPVFEGNYTIEHPYPNDIRQRIYIFDNNLPDGELKNVVVLVNFAVANLPIQADFPFAGTWYDLMDPSGNTTLEVTNTAMQITIPAGQFRIFGNENSSLSTQDIQTLFQDKLLVYPNPAKQKFHLNREAKMVQVYNMLGVKVAEFNDIQEGQGIPSQGLATGVYMLRVFGTDGKTYTSKLLKE